MGRMNFLTALETPVLKIPLGILKNAEFHDGLMSIFCDSGLDRDKRFLCHFPGGKRLCKSISPGIFLASVFYVLRQLFSSCIFLVFLLFNFHSSPDDVLNIHPAH